MAKGECHGSDEVGQLHLQQGPSLVPWYQGGRMFRDGHHPWEGLMQFSQDWVSSLQNETGPSLLSHFHPHHTVFLLSLSLHSLSLTPATSCQEVAPPPDASTRILNLRVWTNCSFS